MRLNDPPRFGRMAPMKRSIFSLLCLSLLCVSLLFGAVAHGQEAPELVIDLRAAPDLDAESLRSALADDLGLPVALGAENAQVVVEATETTIVVRVSRGARPPMLRAIDGTGDRSQRTLRAALLVSNLVRDESSELLALLAPPPRPPVVVLAPAPESPEPSEPEVQPEPPLALAPIAIDFVPGVGVSSAFLGHEERVVAFGALGAWSGMLTGVSISSLVDIVERDARGWQLGGITAAAGRSTGVQLGGVVALSTGPLEGVQLGGAVGFAERVSGAQLDGLLALSAGPVTGVQLAGLSAIAAGRVEGAQLSVVNIATAGMSGAQLGVVNVAGAASEGVQLGVVNVVAGRVSGVQIGLVNVSDDADASIGLVNVHPHGRFQVRAGADTTGLFGVSIVHGARVTHSILSASIDPLGARLTGAIGFGLGVRLQPADIVHVDIDGLVHLLLDEGSFNGSNAGYVIEPRVVVGVSIVPEVFGVVAGLSYQWRMGQTDPGITGPALVTDFGDSGDTHVHGWPALLLGIELL